MKWSEAFYESVLDQSLDYVYVVLTSQHSSSFCQIFLKRLLLIRVNSSNLTYADDEAIFVLHLSDISLTDATELICANNEITLTTPRPCYGLSDNNLTIPKIFFFAFSLAGFRKKSVLIVPLINNISPNQSFRAMPVNFSNQLLWIFFSIFVRGVFSTKEINILF